MSAVEPDTALEPAIARLEQEISTLQDVAAAVLTVHDLEQVLLSINDRLLVLLDSDLAGTFLIDGEQLAMRSCVGHRSMETARLRMRRGQGLAGLVFESGEPREVDDYLQDTTISRDFKSLAVTEDVRSALAVPLRVRGEMTGVIEVWRRRPSVFAQEDVRRMQALASLAAIAIDNARLYEAQAAALDELADARAALEAQVALLRQTAALQRDLTEQVLDNGTLTDLVRLAAEATGCEAVVTTAEGSPLAGHPAPLVERVDDLLAADDGRTVWRHPIQSGNELIGMVYLVGRDRSEVFMETVCGQTAAACALLHLEESAARRARAEAGDEVLWDLLSPAPERRRGALDRARRLHFDIDGERRLIHGAADGLVDTDRQRALDAVREASRRQGQLASARADEIVAIGRDDLERCHAFICDVAAQLTALSPDVRVSWGISAACGDAEHMPAAYEQARTATQSARRLGSTAALAYDELGVVRLLVGTPDAADIDAFMQEMLGPLLAYDEERNGALVLTLEAFFAEDCRQRDAAARLFVHPKTLRYRLEKIRELTGLDLASHTDRMRADLALRIHQVHSGTT